MLGDSDDDPNAVAVQTSAVDEEQREEEEEEPPSEELIENIMCKLWRFNDCYSIANMVNIEYRKFAFL